MIPVTKPFLPPIEEYMAQMQRAYSNHWLTNRGPLVQELEHKLTSCLELDISKMLVTANGTISLQIALKLLGNNGEIITTPFSYVATTAAIAWENCTPVFVDIHPEYLTIDVTKIERAITKKTTCILATHVFGNPCHVEEIEHIAKKHNIKVIYDAAHCFGVKYKDKSIFEYGDVSISSFHATKVFHTGEGGAIFCKDPELLHKIFYSHNFGHNGPTDYYGLGINGKLSELQAAMGLAVLPHMETILNGYKKAFEQYQALLSNCSVHPFTIMEDTIWNYSYFPIIFKTESALLKTSKLLSENKINARRYFFPSLNQLPYTNSKEMPVSEDISGRILCLPMYHDISPETIKQVAKLVIDHESCILP